MARTRTINIEDVTERLNTGDKVNIWGETYTIVDTTVMKEFTGLTVCELCDLRRTPPGSWCIVFFSVNGVCNDLTRPFHAFIKENQDEEIQNS